MISFVDINLLDFECDVIIQSNNCFVTMGTGLAKAIREKYPEVYESDCKTYHGDIKKLGTILPVKLNSDLPSYCFLNYNQYRFGRNKRQVDYEAFYKCLEQSLQKIRELGLKTMGIAYGMSCNNAGGTWPICLCMIEAIFQDSEIEVYICKYKTYQPF
jgi:O-acetyl-ADP-ribose deacetylase (regulator of RNase III)